MKSFPIQVIHLVLNRYGKEALGGKSTLSETIDILILKLDFFSARFTSAEIIWN